MSALPIRVRITLFVMLAATAAVALPFLVGSVDQFEEDIIDSTLQTGDGDDAVGWAAGAAGEDAGAAGGELGGGGVERIGSDIDTGLGPALALVAVVALVGLLALTWFTLGRALRPVEAIARQVDQIGATNLDQRVAVPKANDELRRLAETMNRMLDRIELSDERQRRFVSDASHELRSPITAIRATMEVAATDDTTDWERTAAVVQEENDRLASLVDDLLLLASMDERASSSDAGASTQVDLEEICLAEAVRARPIGVSVRVVTPARVNGDPATLTRAIRNLVDNAVAHAASSVTVEVDRNGTTALVTVSDDGPGVPTDMAEQIFERFVRVDESRARDGTGGAGLGLAIARQIAERHGGTLTLAETPDRGATFLLQLPLYPP